MYRIFIFLAVLVYIPVVVLQTEHATQNKVSEPGVAEAPTEANNGYQGDDNRKSIFEILKGDKEKLSAVGRHRRGVKLAGQLVFKGGKYMVTISKRGVKWLWVKTKNGFKRLGRWLDVLDRWYIFGPMLWLEPSSGDYEYYHYEDYPEEHLNGEYPDVCCG